MDGPLDFVYYVYYIDAVGSGDVAMEIYFLICAIHHELYWKGKGIAIQQYLQLNNFQQYAML